MRAFDRKGGGGLAKKKPNRKNTKIRKYRKPLNLNIGMIIFGVILIYVVICVAGYFRSNPINPYEVHEGTLAAGRIYRGIALRTETVVTAQTAGYINYYAREGERVGVGDIVYTVDETGKLNQYMESLTMGENSLDGQQLSEFRNEIVSFMHGFRETDFSPVYSFKYSLKGTVLNLANSSMLESMQDSSVVGEVQTCRASATGVVSYWVDGYENLQPEQINADVFETAGYQKNQLLGTELAVAGDPAYKLSLSENWCIVIPVEEQDGQKLQEEGYVKVRFLKNQYESWAATEFFSGTDGKFYVKLSFTNSMISFVSERFLEIEILLEEGRGLKIPLSSLAQRSFYLVPEAYVYEADQEGKKNIIRRVYLEDGTASSEVMEVEVYSYDEENKEYFLDAEVLNAGDVLLLTDSLESFTVSKQASLIGVYNMNKGYADFREIQILDQNEEYAIVKSNTRYGLNVYDNIVLDASSVKADQFTNGR